MSIQGYISIDRKKDNRRVKEIEFTYEEIGTRAVSTRNKQYKEFSS